MKKYTAKNGSNNGLKIEEFLRENGFKVTPSRVSILSLFSEKCNPMSAEQIFEKLSPDVDLVTVYRTMASFEEKGIVRRVDLHKDTAYFELNTNHHHHHMVCTNCGKVEKFEQCVADSFVKTAAVHSAQFAEIKSHSLELFGICKVCAK